MLSPSANQAMWHWDKDSVTETEHNAFKEQDQRESTKKQDSPWNESGT